jgi:hypothetical protein
MQSYQGFQRVFRVEIINRKISGKNYPFGRFERMYVHKRTKKFVKNRKK